MKIFTIKLFLYLLSVLLYVNISPRFLMTHSCIELCDTSPAHPIPKSDSSTKKISNRQFSNNKLSPRGHLITLPEV